MPGLAGLILPKLLAHNWEGRQPMENRFEKIVKDIFSFTQFVSEAENEIPNQSSRYYDCWWELEILNASALEDWEISGKPEKWEKWTEKYQTEALQSVKHLFAEEVPENNIVCNISHFLHFADRAEADIPNQSRSYAEYWWEMEMFKMSVLEDWERSGRPLNWEKWQRQYRS